MPAVHTLDDVYYTNAEKAIVAKLAEYRAELASMHGRVEYSVKADKTVVTEMDSRIEAGLRDVLRKFDSSIGLRGEEDANEGNANTYWLIDPIDGTEQFIRGLPGCTNMVSLVVDSKPAMTLVYDFIGDKLYKAIVGKGATCNGQKIHVSNRPPGRAWLEISNFLDFKPRVLSRLSEVCSIVRMRNSATLIATGKLDGYVVLGGGGGPWDYIPRTLLVQEAGGRVANIGSDTYDFTNTSFVATNSVIFDAVMQAVIDAA